jgi:hypothetical protein
MKRKKTEGSMFNSLKKTIEQQIGKANTLDPRASNIFDRAYRNPNATGLGKLFQKENKPLLLLEEALRAESHGNRHYAGSAAVPLSAIQGTIDRDGDFDRDFRPIQRGTELRWQKVATAMLRGVELPPVELVRVGKIYFVKDGHHRISVSKALGYSYIDAIVEVWE